MTTRPGTTQLTVIIDSQDDPNRVQCFFDGIDAVSGIWRWWKTYYRSPTRGAESAGGLSKGRPEHIREYLEGV